jgi:AraC-like DNA-binding protein
VNAGRPAQRRSITSTRLLTEFAADQGLSESQVLSGTGIDLHTLRDPAAEIYAEQEISLVRNIVSTLGGAPGLGFLAGMRYHIVAQGIWGFAVASSPDLRGALDIGVRYFELSFSLAHIFQRAEENDALSIVIDDSAVPPDLRTFLLERDLGALATMQRDIFGTRLHAIHGQVPFDRNPFYEVLATEYLGTTVIFGAAEAKLTFDAEALKIKLPQANPHTAAMYDQQCADLMQRRRARSGISSQVRELLIHCRTASQADVAAGLNMSVRTLRRRLAEEGTTFRELSDETAGMLAEDLLHAGLTVEQVANRLGYSTASTFTVAFRSWRGQTPGQYARKTPPRGPITATSVR